MSNVQNFVGYQSLTQAQLYAWANQSPDNFIGYCVQRNPTSVYNYIVANYPSFGRIGNGLTATATSINNMYTFLLTQYKALQPSQQSHWLLTLGHSIPDQPELQNFCNPKS